MRLQPPLRVSCPRSTCRTRPRTHTARIPTPVCQTVAFSLFPPNDYISIRAFTPPSALIFELNALTSLHISGIFCRIFFSQGSFPFTSALLFSYCFLFSILCSLFSWCPFSFLQVSPSSASSSMTVRLFGSRGLSVFEASFHSMFEETS